MNKQVVINLLKFIFIIEFWNNKLINMDINVFYRLATHRSIKVATLKVQDANLEKFLSYIKTSNHLPDVKLLLAYGTKLFKSDSCNLSDVTLQNDSVVDILLPLPGGKGGFGSLLRAIGAQIEKTTNRDACRDLSGRRLRDIKRSEDLKKLIALQEKLQEERKRRKKEKFEQLKKQTENSKAAASIQELVDMFEDHDYNKRRMEIGDILEAAIDKGIINFKKRRLEEACSTEETRNKKVKTSASKEIEHNGDHSVITGEGNSSAETDSFGDNDAEESEAYSKIKKDQLWLGLDSDDE